MNRVVITGIGAVTPLGNDFGTSWSGTKAGKSGLSTITRFDASNMPYSAAGEIKGFLADPSFNIKELAHTDPVVLYANSAAREAFVSSGLAGCSEGTGVIIGTSRGGITTLEKAFARMQSGARLSPFTMPSTTVNMAASVVAGKLGARGICLGISNACASGANAIGEAYRLIRRGEAGVMIAGGAEAPICRFCFEGYGAAHALSRQTTASASRPFDTGRDGFVLAEGACILVLEELSSAVKRGAVIYGEIIGYAANNDGYHMTMPHRDGEMDAMRKALHDSGVSPDDLDYVNAHATSTPAGDRTESEAIGAVFGNRNVPVGSIKSMTGHMLAASGAYEIACTAMTLREGIIPPTINLTEKDPSCPVNVVTEPLETSVRTAVSNSFGFGGVNASLVLKRFSS